MNFRTEIKIAESSVKVEHYQRILTIGSCFAENIAEQFKFYLFNVFNNPFGVLYNPVSIFNAVKMAMEEKTFSKDDLISNQGEWHSFYHHSDFSHYNFEECLNRINSRTREVKEYLRKCDWVIITLGTSFIYKHIEKSIIVSNCHKIPVKNFERIFLPAGDTANYLSGTIKMLKTLNPAIKIILTVSPVRHIKDGFAENQLSKSSLIVAVNETVEKNKDCFYFPSYEIMLDDLRDYRFYDKDLLHPNKIAIEYIWEKFSECFFSDNCKTAVKDVEPYSKGKKHRMRDIESPQAQKFLGDLSKIKKNLLEKYPYISSNVL